MSQEHRAWHRRAAAGGFSLAEVLIALAVASFALLALVGVLPEGLQSLQNAQRQEAEARMVQQVEALYQLKPWSQSGTGPEAEEDLEFDGNGAPVHTGSRDAVYRVRTEVEEAAPLPNESTGSPFLRRLRVRITRSGGGSFEDAARYREKWLSLVNLDKARPPPAVPGEEAQPATGTPPNP